MIFKSELQKYNQMPEDTIRAELFNALKICNEINAADLTVKVHWALYESDKRLINFKNALSHLEKNNRIEKQLHKDAVDQKLLNFEIRSGPSNREKDAIRLQIKNEELAALNR